MTPSTCQAMFGTALIQVMRSNTLLLRLLLRDNSREPAIALATIEDIALAV
jgi:hypothetical protein